jgi:hypothetical protein
MTIYSPSPLTHCGVRVYITIQYTYSHGEGVEGGELTREKFRVATVHKAGLKILT